MKWTKELLKPIILNIIRSDLRHEAKIILDAGNDTDFESLIEYADRFLGSPDGLNTNRKEYSRFDMIACMEVDLLKSKLEYFGRLKKRKSELGFDEEITPELIQRWRQEKLNTLINNKQ